MANKLYEETHIQAIANSIRGKTGKTDTMTVEEMSGEIDGITGGGGNLQEKTIYTNGEYLPDENYDGFSKVTVLAEGADSTLPVAEESSFGGEATGSGKFYYNGVLLPEIPSDVLAEYPYCWIRNNTTSGYYDLFFSTERFYLVKSDSVSGSGLTKPWYRIEISNYESATEWTYYNDSTANLGIGSDRTVMWSNHDIYQVSNSIPVIYFEATELMPEVQDASWYQITGNTLNGFADEAIRIDGEVTVPITTATMLEIFKKAIKATTIDKELYEYCGVSLTGYPYVFMYYKENFLYVAFATSYSETDAYYGEWSGSGTVMHGTFSVGEVSDTSKENIVRLAVQNSKELEQTTKLIFTGIYNSKVYCNYDTKFTTEGNNTVYRLDQ